jgi:hypothetical protein
MPVGYFSEKMTVFTNSERTPSLTLRMSGYVEGAIRFEPEPQIDFLNIQTDVDRSEKRKMFVRNQVAGESFKIGKIEPDFIRATIEQDPRFKSLWSVTVTIPKGTKTDVKNGFVMVVDQNGAARANLPVKFFIQD